MNSIFFIVGAGRVGASLAHFLYSKGLMISALVEKNPDRFSFLKSKYKWSFITSRIEKEKLIQANRIIISVQDDSIKQLTWTLSKITKIDWRNKVVVHTSGTLPASVLTPLKKCGANTASIHPIYSFSSNPIENKQFNKIWFTIEGDRNAIKIYNEIFSFTGHNYLTVNKKEKKAIHVACVFYANFFVALAEMSHQILQKKIPDYPNPLLLLNPLLASSIRQVTQFGTTAGLTGPVKRGDVNIIRKHQNFLQKQHPGLVNVYRILSHQLLALSEIEEKKKIKIKKVLLIKEDQY